VHGPFCRVVFDRFYPSEGIGVSASIRPRRRCRGDPPGVDEMSVRGKTGGRGRGTDRTAGTAGRGAVSH